MRNVLLVLTVCMAFAASAGSQKPKPTRVCKGSPTLVGPCVVVHGRLRASNGNPSFRIWPVGTNRLLGLFGDEEPIMPAEVLERIRPSENEVYGDFEVCPLTKKRQGEMQLVCMESAKNLVVVPFEKR